MAKKQDTSIPKKEIIGWLAALNYEPLNGKINVYSKSYSDYVIEIDLDRGRIEYPEPLIVHDHATSNLGKRENLVVLECVDRLLSKGYKPDKIELEKNWKLGHKGKGRLDILLKNGKDKPYLMIECKTWSSGHNAEKAKMYDDGGQLISYYIQARNTQFLCLYSSVLREASIDYCSDIINMSSDFEGCKDAQSVFEKWDKNFLSKGIFEREIAPYKVEFKGIIYDDLKDLEDDSSSLIFIQFLEILRRNVVSDKSNAFNKIFNLFICKIVDEDSQNGLDEEMEFQWKGNDDFYSLFDRLNSLYKKGAKDYINIDIEDVSNKDLENLLRDSASNSERIKKAFQKLRLYKNNEFAFKEVYNEDTFLENAIIVKEVVQLLQSFRLKYNQKQQFLGDFFEMLLNTGFKQEVGQYFTPLPLARFICKSLPISTIIDRKNANKEKYFLPYIIDFASGSGHFLTEIMDEVSVHVNLIASKPNFIKGGKGAKDEFNSHSSNFKWAKEYVYGIEKDYRLAKTTKINTFLNGDGEANIVMGDGLDNFQKSKTYTKKLKEIDIESDGTFDIIVANPPYSIKEFANTLNYAKETFRLFPFNSEKGANIECFFVERAKQLLTTNGVAGIIMPVSFLTSSDTINIQARELLFKNFNIKACVYLGEKTFSDTNVFSVVLFLEKRSNYVSDSIEGIVDRFFKEFGDFSCNGIDRVFSKYVEYVYKTISLDEYRDFINTFDTPSKLSRQAKENEICIEYLEEKLDQAKVIQLEKRKIFHFILSYNQKVLVVDSKSGNQELDFLGYEISKRRGKGGIKVKRNSKGELSTKLYSSTDSSDPNKVNYYILKSYANELPVQIPPALKDHLEVVGLCELFDFNSYQFENSIRYGIQHTRFKNVKTTKLKTFFDRIGGVTYEKQDQLRVQTEKMILTSTHIKLEPPGGYIISNPIYLRQDFDLPTESRLRQNDLFVSTSNSLKHLGKVAFIDRDLSFWAGGFCTILRPKADIEDAEMISKHACDQMQSVEFRNFISLYKNSRISNIGADLMNFRIPFPGKAQPISNVKRDSKTRKNSISKE